MHKPSGQVLRDTNGRYGRNGTFAVRFRYPDLITGKRREKVAGGLATHADAKQVLANFMADYSTGAVQADPQFTVQDGWVLYQEEIENRFAVGRLKKNTAEMYKTSWRLYVAPFWAGRKMADVRPVDIGRLFRQHLDSGLTAGSLNVAWHVLRSCFDRAHSNGFVATNPFTRVKKAEILGDQHPLKKARQKVWNRQQLDRFRAAIAERDHPDRYMHELILFTGLRRGEALGVCDDALDLGNATRPATLHVCRQYTTAGGGKAFWDTPKTRSSRRTVVLTVEVVEAVRRQKERRLGHQENPDGALFTEPDGTVKHPMCVSNRFRKLADELELPRIGLHGLRHTFATMALGAALPTKIVSDILGHATIDITANIYQHTTEELAVEAVEAVADVISR